MPTFPASLVRTPTSRVEIFPDRGSKLFAWWLVCLLALLLAGFTRADEKTTELFRSPKHGTATLSPDGKHLAVTMHMDGRMQLGMIDVETGASKIIAGYDKKHITRVSWLDDDRLVFRIVDLSGDLRSTPAGLFSIHRSGGRLTVLMDTPERIIEFMVDQTDWASQPRRMRLISRALASDPNMFSAVGLFPTGEARLYKVDASNGRRSEVQYDIKGITRDFVVDQQQRLRVIVTSNTDDSEETIWYRDDASQPWRRLSTHSTLEAPFSVLGFDRDPAVMLVSANSAKGLSGVYQFDFSSNRPGKLLTEDDQVDIDGALVFAPDTGQLLGVRVGSEPPRTIWFDATMDKLQKDLNALVPGLVHVIHPGSAGAALLVFSYSSREPGYYSIYSPTTRKLVRYLTRRPGLSAANMSPQRVYDYVARDGLPIMAYLTTPKDKGARSLPLVVLVHGGPWSRDEWGFDPTVQFLASLGYAVLQPQFRGSTGFGIHHFRKSFGQWGLSMQDDLTDGVLSLVKQGVVDPGRVCIMGSSYGGYATMMGLVKDPDLYRCGINLFGVTNLFYHSSEGRSGIPEETYSMNQLLGDPVALKTQFENTSPVKQAARIKAPVLMVYGEKDRRVKLVHGDDMNDALKKAGKTVEFLSLAQEEHGIADEKTRVAVYDSIAAFLRKHNPPD